MPSTAIVDVAIGIAFIYLFFSLICSVVNEGFAAFLSLRAKNLVAGISSLFSDSKTADGKQFVQAIYEHGLVRGLFKDLPVAAGALTNISAELANAAQRLKKVSLPSYIPAGTFTTALMDAIAPPNATVPRSLDDVRRGIMALPDSLTKQALLSLLASTQGELPEFQAKIEDWYNASMDRAAGWYKRNTQKFLLAIALVVALTLNVDTLHIAVTLWNNPVARQATVDLAQKYAEANPIKASSGPAKAPETDKGTNLPGDSSNTPQTESGKTPEQKLMDQATTLSNLGKSLPVPFGWSTEHGGNGLYWLEKVIGWIITMLALSLGAPFWFDVLNKFMVVRSTVKPQEKSQPEGSKD